MSVLGWGKAFQKGKTIWVEDRNSEAEKALWSRTRKDFCAVSLKIKKRKNQDKKLKRKVLPLLILSCFLTLKFLCDILKFHWAAAIYCYLMK